MKKLMILGISILALAFALPAFADVNLSVVVDKTKTKTVTEIINIIKDIEIWVTVDVVVDGAAEAEALANVFNHANDVDGLGDAQFDNLLKLSTITGGSINNYQGIVLVNQDTGNMQIQGNIVSLALTDTDSSLSHAEASVDQRNFLNSVTEFECCVGPLHRIDTLDGVVNSAANVGIVGVNQSSGNMNNQNNAVALAVGLGDVQFALAESDLGQVNSNNFMNEVITNKLDLITNSFNNHHGIASVNQSAGNMNNQSAVISMAILH